MAPQLAYLMPQGISKGWFAALGNRRLVVPQLNPNRHCYLGAGITNSLNRGILRGFANYLRFLVQNHY